MTNSTPRTNTPSCTLLLLNRLREPGRRECLHRGWSPRGVPLQQGPNKLHPIRARHGPVDLNRRSIREEALINAVRELVSARLAERMGARQDLMQDDPERPHVDFGGVRVVGGRAMPHLRCDIGERADLRVKAAGFVGPFRVVEVAELDPDRKDGGDEDVLRVLE